jgi:hypothetical protein
LKWGLFATWQLIKPAFNAIVGGFSQKEHIAINHAV